MEHAAKLQLFVAEVLFFCLLSASLQERCRLLGCTEVCKITGLRSSSALPVRRQSSGSLWHPHTPHLCKSSPHPAPAVTLTA